MRTASYQIDRGLYLALVTIEGAAPVTEPVATNHVVVIDGSGSMYGSMDRIRSQLKVKLPTMMGAKDTLTLIVFSSRGECKLVCEGEPVASMADLRQLHQRIDAEVRATNLTGFVDPLEQVARLLPKLAAQNAGVASLWFMSDGYDNQWSRSQIIEATSKACAGMGAVTVVEYGSYADRNLLAEMAARGGGRHIFAQDFDAYEPAFAETMGRHLAKISKVAVPLSADVIGGFAFGFADTDLLAFSQLDGKVSVADSMERVAYLSPALVGSDAGALSAHAKALAGGRLAKGQHSADAQALSYAYAAASLFSVRMRPEVVYPLLRALGDVRLIEAFSVCFGKQRYTDFMETTRAAALGADRFQKGYDPTRVPADDAFTVFQLLETLASDDESRLLIDRLKYHRIGRARLDSSDNLTAAEASEVEALTSQIRTLEASALAERRVSKIKEARTESAALQAQIEAILSRKKEALKFVAVPAPEGIPIHSLVYNEEQPNISIHTTRRGHVRIKSRVDAELQRRVADTSKESLVFVAGLRRLPEQIETTIHRNYTIVKDGAVWVEELPVVLRHTTWAKLLGQGFDPGMIAGAPVKIDADRVEVTFLLRQVPVLNRKMVNNASAVKLFELEYQLTQQRAAQKVYNGQRAETAAAPRSSKGFAALYGEQVAGWLKDECGLTDYNGYNPKTTLAESIDFYMGRFLTVLLYEEGAMAKLLSGKQATGKLDSFPSVKELGEKLKKGGKLTAGAALMADVLVEIEEFKASSVYKSAKDKEKLLADWLEGQQKATTREVRKLLAEKAKLIFSTIVGQTWFSDPEFTTPQELTLPDRKHPEGKKLLGNSATLLLNGVKVDCLVGQEEREVRI